MFQQCGFLEMFQQCGFFHVIHKSCSVCFNPFLMVPRLMTKTNVVKESVNYITFFHRQPIMFKMNLEYRERVVSSYFIQQVLF
jgi:hypothetical protein